MDPFLHRAVEYWLDSANELTYQPLFCQWLTSADYVVKHVSGPGQAAFEEGKDVIATKDNVAHAFQLKGGYISLRRWRREVLPQIRELRELRIKHPGIDGRKPHKSYLITNGELGDSVRTRIDSRNKNGWNDNPLIVWRRGDLLNKFIGMADGILPKDLTMYRRLVDLIFANGTGPADIPKTESFFRDILKIDEERNNEQRRRDIAAAMVYASLITGCYRRKENYISTTRILVVLISHVLLLADRYTLHDRLWANAYKIMWADVLNQARSLTAEVADSDILDSSSGLFGPFRKHEAALFMFALHLSELVSGAGLPANNDSGRPVRRYRPIAAWGEASFLPCIFLSMILKRVGDAGDSSSRLLQRIVVEIIERNGRKAKRRPGLVPPYFGVEFGVNATLESLSGPNDNDFTRTSYYLQPVVEMLARAGHRKFLGSNWREISLISLQQFVPTRSWQHYLWRSPEGVNKTIVQQESQSWIDLVALASGRTAENLPRSLCRYPEFLPFFLAVFPHRLDPEILGYLDRTTMT